MTHNCSLIAPQDWLLKDSGNGDQPSVSASESDSEELSDESEEPKTMKTVLDIIAEEDEEEDGSPLTKSSYMPEGSVQTLQVGMSVQML